MKKLITGLIIGALGGAGAMWMLRTSPATATEAAESAAKSGESTAANPLQIPATKRVAAGIVVGSPRSMALAPEVEAFGRVLDPTPYVSLAAELATAEASLDASEKELARVRKLFNAGGNASAQAVETADAAAVRDRAAVASARIRLLAGWGQQLTDQADINRLGEILAKGATLLRIDLLPGTMPTESLHSARITLLGGKETFQATVIGPAPVADAQVQGLSFLAVIHGRTLPAGVSLNVTLPGAGEAKPTVLISRSAVVYHEGSAWVYVLGEKDTFQRRRVTLGRPIDDDVVIESGVAADDKVATGGAQQLLSAELEAGGTLDER
jgi:hypothetical protein